MKREHQEGAGGDGGGGGGGGDWFAAVEQEKGKALMGMDDGVDELLAALGYKVRSSDMADVAQKLEQLEMAMGSNAAANDDALLAHLAFDTVHYNPSDLSNWVDNILLELNAPPPFPQPPPPADPLSRQFDLSPAVTEQYTIGAVDLTDGSPCSPADVDGLKPQASTASSGWLISKSGHQPEVATSLRDRKRLKVCSSPASSTITADAATSAAAQQVVIVDSQEAGIRLVHALMACAEAVQKENLKAAGAIVKRISVLATSQGGAMRKVAGYFAQALGRRLYRPQPTCGVGCSSSLESAALDDMLHHHFYESCPYLKFAHFTANQAILEAFAGFRRVHVVDFGMRQGLQWPALLQALALRQGGPPSFRLTGIGPPQPDNSDALQEVGWKLAQLAETIRVDFRYRGFVAASLADLEPHMLLGPEADSGGVEDDEPEVVAVNSIFELHRLLARPGALEKVLGTIRAVRPRIVTVVEQEANHNGRTFLDRFTEALHYYSTMFDSLEGGASPAAAAAAAEVGGHDQAMAEIYLGRQIYNVVACEGAERTERHETLPQWRARLSRAGFDSVPIGSNAFKQASMLLALFAGGEGYRVEENEGCLTLGWHTRPLIATSAWRATGDPLSTSASF